MKHVNLHFYAADTAEVYEALQRDYARDSQRVYWMQSIGAAMVGAAAFGWPDRSWTAPLAICGFAVLLVALQTFIDNSNRNWAMHLIDWVKHQSKDQSPA